MEVIESSCVAKTGNPDDNEDVLVIAPAFVAVIDGATDKSGRRIGGLTGGRFAALTIAQVVQTLRPSVDLPECIAVLSEALRAAVAAHGDIEDHLSPSASVIVYSAHHDQIWRVGDCRYRDGETVSAPLTKIEAIASAARATLLRMLIEDGADLADLARDDPGRAMILPLLRLAGFAQNNETSEFGHGVIDGQPVPPCFCEAIAPKSGQIVLASDGYVELAPTLAASEAALAQMLASDPLRIDARHPGAKGVRPGHLSFDDRTYVRLRRG